MSASKIVRVFQTTSILQKFPLFPLLAMCTYLSEGGTNDDAVKIKLRPPNKFHSIFCKTDFYLQRDAVTALVASFAFDPGHKFHSIIENLIIIVTPRPSMRNR